MSNADKLGKDNLSFFLFFPSITPVFIIKISTRTSTRATVLVIHRTLYGIRPYVDGKLTGGGQPVYRNHMETFLDSTVADLLGFLIYITIFA